MAKPTIIDAMPRLSPFEVVGETTPAAVAAGATSLSPRDRAELDRLLAKPVDFMPGPGFDAPGAEARLFDDAGPPIPRPDVGWYQPSMPREESKPGAKPKVFPRLTAAQERVLFHRYNYCRSRVARAQHRILGSDVASGAAVREMLGWHRRAQDHRAWIAQLNVALVPAMARRCGINDSVLPEFISEGHLVLLASIDKFDAERGFKFSSYACRSILKAFGRQAMKLARDHAMFPAAYDPAADRSNHQEFRRAEQRDDSADELRRIVIDNRAALSEMELTIITRRYPMAAVRGAELRNTPADASPAAGKGPTLADVGKAVGLTKERVRQLEVRALKKLRKTLDEEWLS
ncbi:MAG: sigma-70 family RNA polymerase sigma factor [Planctomycetota bacterium]|nr:sigma-70 family RNA polymerase sigma factor [Planctomycetota bacterium]